MSCGAPAIPDRAEAAAILLSIISGCFPCARACAGLTGSTSRSCRPCDRAGIPVQWTDITVRHTGYSDRALRTKKLERDTRILLGELGERPNDPFVLFNLGMIAVERKEWGDALGYLKRSLAGSAPSDSITRKLYALIARVHEMLGDTDAALRTCAEGLSLDPEDAELWFRKGVLTGTGASRARRKQPGGGSSRCAGPRNSPAWTRESMGMSPGATWRRWPPNAVTTRRCNGSGGLCSLNARATGRH